MNEEEKYDKIERYLSGDLTGRERKTFEEDMKSDPSLAEEVKLHSDLADALKEKDVADLEEKLANIIQDNRPRRIRLGVRKWLAIAASILFLVTMGMALYYNLPVQDTPRRVYMAYLALPADLNETPSFRSSGKALKNKTENPFQTGYYDLYQNKQYTAALAALEQLPKDFPNLLNEVPGTYHYYLGVTLLQLNRTEEALQAFGKVNSGLYTENAAWYRALCLLNLEGTSTKAQNALEDIANGNQPQSDEALEILDKLFEK